MSKARKILSNATSARCISFVLSSAVVFVGLDVIFFYAYGFQFLQETYLHHLSRRDPRHNFSVYFYPIYLQNHAAEFFPSLDGFLDVAALAFGPPAALMLLASWRLSDHLPLCWLIITMVFVAFNKVRNLMEQVTMQSHGPPFCILLNPDNLTISLRFAQPSTSHGTFASFPL